MREKIRQLIEQSTLLNEKERENLIQQLPNIIDEDIRKMIDIFEESNKKEQKQKLQRIKKLEAIKAFVQKTDHELSTHAHKLITEIEEKDRKKDAEQAEKLING